MRRKLGRFFYYHRKNNDSNIEVEEDRCDDSNKNEAEEQNIYCDISLAGWKKD